MANANRRRLMHQEPGGVYLISPVKRIRVREVYVLDPISGDSVLVWVR